MRHHGNRTLPAKKHLLNLHGLQKKLWKNAPQNCLTPGAVVSFFLGALCRCSFSGRQPGHHTSFEWWRQTGLRMLETIWVQDGTDYCLSSWSDYQSRICGCPVAKQDLRTSCPPIHPSIHLFDLSIYLSIYLSVCLSVYLSVYLSICLSVWRPIYLAI